MKRIVFLFAFASLMLFAGELVYGQGAGEVYVDSVTGKLGSPTSDTVLVNSPVRFILALRNDNVENLLAFTCGFQVYTKLSDANPTTPGYFDALTSDSLSIPGGWYYFPPFLPTGHFDNIYFNNFGLDGLGRDTAAFSAVHTTANSPGLPQGWDTPYFWIETQAHNIGDTLCIDSVTVWPPGGAWLWSYSSGNLQPDWNGPYCFEITCCNGDGIRGDADYDGQISVADVTYLVQFLFQNRPPPPCIDEGNVDGIVGVAGPIDIADLTYLVAYLFQGGSPPPACP